jgi:hypothetical protein
MPSCSSGLGFFLFSFFCLVAPTAFSCQKVLYCCIFIHYHENKDFLQEKAVEATTKQKEEKRKKPKNNISLFAGSIPPLRAFSRPFAPSFPDCRGASGLSLMSFACFRVTHRDQR